MVGILCDKGKICRLPFGFCGRASFPSSKFTSLRVEFKMRSSG